PVEISLPVRTDVVIDQDIQVKIDHFDVELMSDRSLNVTGVLSLDGWEQQRSEEINSDSKEFFAEYDAGIEQRDNQTIELELSNRAEQSVNEPVQEEEAIEMETSLAENSPNTANGLKVAIKPQAVPQAVE